MAEVANGLEQQLRVQAGWCADLGSSMYAELLVRAADNVAEGGVVADVLAGHEDDPLKAVLSLRFMGAVHRLVLDGRAPELAPYYPSVGGDGDPHAAWPVVRSVLARHGEAVRGLLDSAPQTNEVGRAASLIGGLLHVARETGLPIRLLEIGSSAGLNLQADQFRYSFADGRSYGPADSPVVLTDAWLPGGSWPPLDVALSITERIGSDLAPVDVTDEDGRLRLLSYVWPDQTERIVRLRGAIDIARRVPATVVTTGADEFLRDLKPSPGQVTVVWHSIMWQYVPRAEKTRVTASLERAGAAATPDAPLAHLAFEPRRQGDGAVFAISLRLWPGGEERLLGEAPPHGLPVTWY